MPLLHWLTRDEDIRRSELAPYRLLEAVPALSYGDASSENMLIQGDNLDALKALLPYYAGKVKCIYIDPPYNTGSAFTHYDDNLEHATWLGLMYPRLELLWKLLRPDGLLAVQIDDNEFARLFLILGEICGEPNLKVITVKMAEPTGVKMTQVLKVGGIPKLKEYLILAGKSGVRGLTVERLPKGQWDHEYRVVLGQVSREEILELKAIIEEEPRSPQDVQRADSICAQFTFEPAEVVCRRETGGRVTEEWLQENAGRIVRTVATTNGA